MAPRLLLGEPLGQSWVQLAELGLAFILSASIGLEREIRQKSAGLRTYTLVGFSSALVMLVSKYGFTNILESGRVVLDPSRIAAQIVSGIGFIGGGLIFVRKDIVRGLTTAATVWLTAAVGMACGAGLPILAIAVTVGHFVVVFVFPSIERRLPKSRWAPSTLQISYQDGRGVLREVLAACTRSEFSVSRVQVERDPSHEIGDAGAASEEILSPENAIGDNWAPRPKGVVTLRVEVRGAKSVARLAERLSEIDGVTSVNAGDGNLSSD
jgi:putative Mg2+ transporter-C (MgtC) family protein